MISGWGTSLTMATSQFTCQITDCTPPGATRAVIDTSHTLTSEAKTFIPSDLVDWGELKLEIGFDPGVSPPINEDPETCTLTFKNGETWVFQGFMTGYEPKGPLEDKMTADVTLKVTGAVAITDV